MKKLTLLTVLLLAPWAALYATDVVNLRCEYRENPFGIDVVNPRLSWIVEGQSDKGTEAQSGRGIKQTAYQVLVASSEKLLKKDMGDLWDSGKVESEQSIHVEYAGPSTSLLRQGSGQVRAGPSTSLLRQGSGQLRAGPSTSLRAGPSTSLRAGTPLASRMQCHWKVRVWTAKSVDGGQKPSPWSKPATWTMGLMDQASWNAKWIAAVAKFDQPLPKGGGVGYHAAEAASENEAKWVQVDLGGSVPIERVVLHALKHGDAGNSGKGFGFPLRFRIEASDDVEFKTVKMIGDHTAADYINPGHVAVPFEAGGVLARYIRVTATKLWNRRSGGNPFCFALAQMEVISTGKNTALKAAVTAKDSVENGGWAKASLTDGQRFSPQNKELPKGDAVDLKPAASIQLRKEFALDKDIKRAVVYICGLGFYELSLNGRKVGDHVLDPGWTNYRKTCLYTAYDVTTQVTRGKNAIGVMLGNGMYNIPGGRYTKFKDSFGPPKLILQLYVEYSDGTSATVVSDESWTWAPSPVVFSCVYGGEDYDARKEMPGWDKAGFNTSAFKPVLAVDGPGGKLSSQAAPPIKVMQEYKPVKITQPKPGIWVYDFGQNCASMPRLTVKGVAGGIIKMMPGELLHDDGLVSQGSSGGPSFYTYTLKGGESETWSPRFFYYGSRYLQVEAAGHDGSPAPQVIELISQFVHSSAREVGKFTCSSELVNRVHGLIMAAFKSNLQSVLTDCPHREKLGWLECAHLLTGCVMYNFDAPTFYAKIVNDMSEAQLENGMVPDIAPEYVVFKDGFRDSPEWGSAYVIAPWQVYQMYGDRSLLERHYEGMKRYVDYLKSKSTDHIVAHGLGDWYDMPWGQTSKGLTATAVYYQDLLVLKNAAALLGKTDEARQFEGQAKAVKDAFNRKFFNAEKNQYDRNSQTANAMPLVLGLVPEDRRIAVLAGLVAQVRAGGYRVKAGDVGFNYLMLALSDGEQGDVLYDMLIRDDGPGYAYQLKKGATSLTEAWDTNPKSSQNHCMLGHIEEWFYRGLGGLTFDPSGLGFKKIIIKPQIVGDLKWVKCSYDSLYGKIVSNWKRDPSTSLRAGGGLTMDVTIPPNTTATVYVPAEDAASVLESGKPVSDAKDVKFMRMENNAAVFEVGSGSYHFCSQLAANAAADSREAADLGQPSSPANYLAPVVQKLEQVWPKNHTVNIVFHGHSVPAGYFKTPAVDSLSAYPNLLRLALAEKFTNAVINVIVTAVGGEASDNGAARFEAEVLPHQPDVLFIDYALNDRRIGLEKAKAAWTKMIQKALATKVKVILLTPTPDQKARLDDPADPLNQHAEQIRRLAAEYHVGLVDSLARFKAALAAGTPLTNLMAQVNHPNAAGHQLVAGELVKWFPLGTEKAGCDCDRSVQPGGGTERRSNTP